MNMVEKNGQPSMEEILASIRRIIAEEPASQTHGDFRGGQPIMLKGDGVLEDAGDFDLPAIFRSSTTTAAPERPAPLLGRLSDAIRSATTASSEPHVNGAAHDEASDVNGASAEPIQDYSLSSLKPIHVNGTNGHHQHLGDLNGVRHMNGSHAGLNGHDVSAAAPSPAPAANGAAAEPKREMASFKDTKFMRMSSAPTTVAPVAPAPVSPAPVEMARAPVEGVSAPMAVEDVVPVMPEAPIVPEAIVAPQVVAMPPPPLPASATEDAAAEGVGSIEDTTADLLRPMLRQWLADNMPRMVEKALHIEIAESVKPIRKA